MTRMDARGIYRFVLRFASPESMIRHAQFVLGLYLDGPTLTVSTALARRPGDEQIAFRFDNAFGFHDDVWQGMLGSAEALCELSGGLDPEARCIETDSDAGWMAGEVCWRR
jgi:hypothetical protein